MNVYSQKIDAQRSDRKQNQHQMFYSECFSDEKIFSIDTEEFFWILHTIEYWALFNKTYTSQIWRWVKKVQMEFNPLQRLFWNQSIRLFHSNKLKQAQNSF